MNELKIACVYLGQFDTGHADVLFGDHKMQVNFDEATSAELKAIALAFIQQEQRKIADDIASAQPALLADWTEA